MGYEPYELTATKEVVPGTKSSIARWANKARLKNTVKKNWYQHSEPCSRMVDQSIGVTMRQLRQSQVS
jgi:hypothetical protein